MRTSTGYGSGLTNTETSQVIAGIILSFKQVALGGQAALNQGPPDLEEIWRDFIRRIQKMLGRSGGSNSGNNNSGGDNNKPAFTPKQFGGGIGLLLALFAVFWISSGFYIVDASQRGIVLQFGRFKETTEPGLRWRFPWPFQSNEVVNLSAVRTIEIGYRGTEKNKVPKEALMLTDDENIVSVEFAVQYLLKDPMNYVFKNRYPDDTVMQAAETAIREVVGKSKMDFVLYEGRDVIAANTQSLMQQILDLYETGIQIRSVTMQSTQPPEQVQAAFDDAVKAGQDKERQKNEGQAYANTVIPLAQGAAARLEQEAAGYKARMIATADGDTSRFSQILTEYSKAPEVTRQRLYLETMQQVYSNTSKIMIDAKGSGNLLYLPLDKLMQATAAATAAAAPDAAATANVANTGSAYSAPIPPQLEKTPTVERSGDYKSRSSLDSRDRGDR